MATVKIDTAVDSGDFDKFLSAFKQYQDAAAKQPSAWKAVAESAEDTNKNFAEAAAAMLSLGDSMESVLNRARALEDTSKRTVSFWDRLGRATRTVSGNVKSTTASLFTMAKWTTGAALAGGLGLAAGGAALYGMDVLGHSVARQRSTSLGLGTTYGGLASARVNYAKYGDADAALARINAAQTDPSNPGRLGFNRLGIKNYETRDSADVLAEVLEKSKKFLDDTPQGLLTNRLENSGVGALLPQAEAQRIKGSGAGEAAGDAGRMRSDRNGLELGADTQRKWQTFSTQLTRAGEQIETVLVNRLVALAPGLSSLSESVTHLAEEALKKDGPISHWLTELNAGVETLASEIDKPEFQTHVKEFMRGIGRIALQVIGFGKSIASLAHWFAGIVGPAGATLTPLGTGSSGDRYGGRSLGSASSGHHGGRQGFSANAGGTGANSHAGMASPSELMDATMDQLRKEGVAEEHLRAAASALLGNAAQESRFNPNAVHDHGTGYGVYGARLERRDQMLKWLRDNGYAQNDAKGQMRQMAHAAMTDKHYARTAQALREATKENLGAVTNTVGTNFESPAAATANYQGRRDNAASSYNAAPVTVRIQKNTGGNPVTSAAAMKGGAVAP